MYSVRSMETPFSKVSWSEIVSFVLGKDLRPAFPGNWEKWIPPKWFGGGEGMYFLVHCASSLASCRMPVRDNREIATVFVVVDLRDNNT